MNKLVMVWLIALTVLIFWIKFVPELDDLWFHYHQSASSRMCDHYTKDLQGFINGDTMTGDGVPGSAFSWISLDWTAYTTCPNN